MWNVCFWINDKSKRHRDKIVNRWVLMTTRTTFKIPDFLQLNQFLLIDN